MMIQFHVHTNVYSLNSGHLTLPVMIFTSEIYDVLMCQKFTSAKKNQTWMLHGSYGSVVAANSNP